MLHPPLGSLEAAAAHVVAVILRLALAGFGAEQRHRLAELRLRLEYMVAAHRRAGRPLVRSEAQLERVGDLALWAAAEHHAHRAAQRSEERRVGKECVRKCRSRREPYHYKTNT